MDFEIYTIKDVCSGTFSDLRLFAKRALAVRWFRSVAPESPFCGDLQLYKVGHYNNESGFINADLEFIEAGVPNEKA